MPEQCEQPVTASANAGTNAGDCDSNSDSNSDGARCSEPGLLDPEDCPWGDDLGVAALYEEVNRLLQLEEIEEPDRALLPMLASTSEGLRGSENNGSGTGTSTWYKGSYPLCRRPPLCVQADIQRMERDRERQLRDKPLLDKWPRVSRADKLGLLYEGIVRQCGRLVVSSFLTH